MGALNVFDLAAKISLDSSGYDKGISNAKSALDGLGTAIKAVAGVSTAAVSAASTGVGILAKQSVSAYGNYEQLVGGVETLFGKSAGKVLENSEKAFKSAGMSMNEYMETSIQSAASLINSLGGDQAKAAELMDMSITDMSDNVNKMGTTMEAVQNAYRGFSRGNFTMLDNLALGFAGTKEGMQELLNKAEQISGIKYDISSYSDIVQAIHVVQKEMGITGTTAEEAANTVQGSAGSMKAAWENLITGIANKNADLDKLVGDFVASAETSIGNILPIVEQALNGIGQLVEKTAPIIANKLPKAINRILPKLVKSGVTLFGAIVNGVAGSIVEVAPSIITLVEDTLTVAANGIIDNASIVINRVAELFEGLARWSKQNLPSIITIGADIIVSIVDGISDNLPSIIQSAIGIVGALASSISNNVGKITTSAVNLVATLASELGKQLPKLVPEAVKMVAKIAETLTAPDSIEKMVSAAADIVTGLVTGIINSLPIIVEEAPVIIENLVTGLTSEESFGKLLDGAGDVITALAGYLTDPQNLVSIFNSGVQIIMSLIKGMGSMYFMIQWKVAELMQAAIDEISKWLGFGKLSDSKFYKKGAQIVTDLAMGIESAVDKIKEAMNKVKNALDLNSNTLSAGNLLKKGIRNSIIGSVPGAAIDIVSYGLGHAKGGVTAHATGGYLVNRPVLTTGGDLFGEEGREVILPLDTNTGWIDELATRINKDAQPQTVNYITFNLDGAIFSNGYDTDRFIEQVSQRLDSLKFAQTAAKGGVNW